MPHLDDYLVQLGGTVVLYWGRSGRKDSHILTYHECDSDSKEWGKVKGQGAAGAHLLTLPTIRLEEL